MRIGKFDKRFTFEKATTTTNSFGDEVQSWATVGKFWCYLKQGQASEGATPAEARAAVEKYDAIVRYNSKTKAITANQNFRAIYHDEEYGIVGCVDMLEKGRNAFIHLILEKRGDG